MDRIYHSIFNDVLGPIMTGPSSSHSAGCARIGRTARGLFGRDIYRADIVFEEKGSYPGTYIGQGSDFGFTGGLMGFSPDDIRLRDAVTIAKDEGRDIRFLKGDLGFHHPNEAEIRVYSENGSIEMTLRTFSTGGGMFEITEMDGFPIMIDGGSMQAFVLCDGKNAVDAVTALNSANGFSYTVTEGENGFLVTVKEKHGDTLSSLASLREEKGIRYVRFSEPVMPVVRQDDGIIPFYNAEEAMRYRESNGGTMWELALAYERGFGSISDGEIFSLVEKVKTVMEKSTCPPDEKTNINGFLPYSCRKMKSLLGERTVVDTGLLEEAMLAAISVMENSCAHNIVVASPTAGSSGVVPAAVVSVGRRLGKTDDEINKALLASGLVGVFIANQATFGGEVGACQAENGSASAMAAAGVVQLMGGGSDVGFRAAAMAMQNMLGLICDPVAGLTEIPCISRNVSAAANAVMSANMALLGFDPVISLDETIITMKKTGEMLPSELKCTCRGGLCMTPTGCRITKEIDAKRPKL